jgi:hypothetical protein
VSCQNKGTFVSQQAINILYLGNSQDGSAPGDRRRFLAFGQMMSNIKIYFREEPGISFDILVYAIGGDLVKALALSGSIPKLVVDYSNHYLVEKSWFKSLVRNQFFTLTKGHDCSYLTYRKSLKEVIRRADLVIYPSVSHEMELSILNNSMERLTDYFGRETFSSEVQSVFKRKLFWEGQAVNLRTLEALAPIVNSKNNLNLNVVSDPYFGSRFFRKSSANYCSRMFSNVVFDSWSAGNVGRAASKSALGVIPLDLSDDFIASKPENKLVYMWLLGLPALCSPSASYRMLAQKTSIDFICSSLNDWDVGIDTYLSNGRYRNETAAFLNDYAKKNYDDNAQYLKWKNAFEKHNIF